MLDILSKENRINKKGKKIYGYICQCHCGHIGWHEKYSVDIGSATNCGCERKKKLIKKLTTHGHTKHPLYKKWLNIRKRCYDPKTHNYKNYGGRGIKLSEEWHDSKKFIEDLLPLWKEGLTIERVDVNKGYQRDNVIFIERPKQGENKTNTIYVEWHGERVRLRALCKQHNITVRRVCSRLSRGFSLEDALSLDTIRKCKNPPDMSKPSFWEILSEELVILPNGKRTTIATCRCRCGVIKKVNKCAVTKKRSRSCGCVNKRQ